MQKITTRLPIIGIYIVSCVYPFQVPHKVPCWNNTHRKRISCETQQQELVTKSTEPKGLPSLNFRYFLFLQFWYANTETVKISLVHLGHILTSCPRCMVDKLYPCASLIHITQLAVAPKGWSVFTEAATGNRHASCWQQTDGLVILVLEFGSTWRSNISVCSKQIVRSIFSKKEE